MTKAKISDYRPQRRNANKHNQRGMGLLQVSIEKDGFIGAMTATDDGEIIAGSARLEKSAEVFGVDAEPIVIETDGTRPIIVQRTDIPNAADVRAKRLSLADNRVQEIDLEWDTEVLQGLSDFDDIDLADWWNDKELIDLGIELEALPEDPGADIDRAEELQEKWCVETGQLWQLGEHRLICGDCTDADVVERVMGGERYAIVSDPPYGISVDTSWLSVLNVKHGKPPNKSDDLLLNDDGDLDLSWIYKNKEWLVFGFPYIARKENYTGLLVWDKRGVGGEDGLGNPVEVAASNSFSGYRLKRHVWAGYIKEAGEEREPHPTQKPIGILEDAICLVKNEIILDPFLGSGTTIIACERLSRQCRAVEISPAYVAVALERWHEYTGEMPELMTE